MVLPKRASYVFIGVVLVMIVSACGGGGSSSGTTSSSGSTQSVPTVAPTPVSTVQTAQVTVNGKATTVLTNAQGMTLYYFTPDTAAKLACSGGCAKAWPPLVFNGSSTPTSTTTLPGTLSVLNDANGNQVQYNGHLLYTYAGDTAPGMTTGEGLFGKWFVCTPTLAALTK